MFEPRRLHAEILLSLGNKVKAAKTIGVMRKIVNSRKPDERRKNYRQYLETYSHYLTEVRQFDDAKKLFSDSRVFTDDEREHEIPTD